MELLFDTGFAGNGILCEDESRHAVSVMRHKEGDMLYVTNGRGDLYHCRIVLAHHKRCELELIGHQHLTQRHPRLHMAVAPTKNIDRYELFLEKSTELGIDEITPLLCDHSERARLRPDRLEKILIAAMKQSLKYHLPQLNEPCTVKEFIAKADENCKKVILHCRESKKDHLFNSIHKGSDTIIFVGPEGDFSVSEIDLVLRNGFCEATLGDNRLRTETAAIAACHIFNLKNEI